ncbi:hypothetical protein J6590_076370 [Homalodisca vitripennis]|nr:hypothetical protein J6590_076370 [Homalodisca vitripennis]
MKVRRWSILDGDTFSSGLGYFHWTGLTCCAITYKCYFLNGSLGRNLEPINADRKSSDIIIQISASTDDIMKSLCSAYPLICTCPDAVCSTRMSSVEDLEADCDPCFPLFAAINQICGPAGRGGGCVYQTTQCLSVKQYFPPTEQSSTFNECREN